MISFSATASLPIAQILSADGPSRLCLTEDRWAQRLDTPGLLTQCLRPQATEFLWGWAGPLHLRKLSGIAALPLTLKVCQQQNMQITDRLGSGAFCITMTSSNCAAIALMPQGGIATEMMHGQKILPPRCP